jgi:DNA mismatch repair protein MutS2
MNRPQPSQRLCCSRGPTASICAFLDRTALEGADTVFVIHGHGTGALRKVVREYLATSPYVGRFRAGGAGEGGDGVSVVSLKG